MEKHFRDEVKKDEKMSPVRIITEGSLDDWFEDVDDSDIGCKISFTDYETF